MPEKRIGASAIAELMCRARATGENRKHLLYRVKYFVSQGVLRDGVTIDRRGVKEYPIAQAYRMALFLELIDLGLGTNRITNILEDADQSWPKATMKSGRVYPGGLGEAINGVQRGERWALLFYSVPDEVMRQGVSMAAYVMESGAGSADVAAGVDAAGDAPAAPSENANPFNVATRVHVALDVLFEPLNRALAE